ncbi:MAG: hypothetical protein F9K29_23900 [Hyphomicrobiaceae bacterium]|nr:MAG: hypothetical protein F9K29_23900 [Hyphomicrobiaceae bacterium]
MLRCATSKSRLIALGGLAAAIAAGAASLWQTDLLLSRGFGKALQSASPALSFAPTAVSEWAKGPVAGDEGYWLTRAELQSPTAFPKPLAVGDRITISGGDGRQRQLQVADLKAIGGTMAVRNGSAGAHPRLMLVTCNVVGDEAKRTDDGPVRFIVEVEPVEAVPAPTAKSL